MYIRLSTGVQWPETGKLVKTGQMRRKNCECDKKEEADNDRECGHARIIYSSSLQANNKVCLFIISLTLYSPAGLICVLFLYSDKKSKLNWETRWRPMGARESTLSLRAKRIREKTQKWRPLIDAQEKHFPSPADFPMQSSFSCAPKLSRVMGSRILVKVKKSWWRRVNMQQLLGYPKLQAGFSSLPSHPFFRLRELPTPSLTNYGIIMVTKLWIIEVCEEYPAFFVFFFRVLSIWSK